VYIGLVAEAGVPMEYHVWAMAERFGWTLEYIDSIPLARWYELIQIDEARARARNSLIGKAPPQRKR